MAKITVRKLDGAKKGDATLPDVFDTPFRPDVIRKAVNAARANRRQPYGPSPMAGAMHSTASIGKGRGMSRVPRTDDNAGALAPPTVGGRRAHPPSPRKDWSEKVNKKERRLAIRSGVAATKDFETVTRRGHRVDEKTALPIVVESAFEKLEKTQDLIASLEKLGVGDDVVRARTGRKIRAGRGKTRGRRLKSPRSALIVAKDITLLRRAAGNLVGVEVTTPEQLNTEDLAPGGDAGRLTIYTEDALKALEDWQ